MATKTTQPLLKQKRGETVEQFLVRIVQSGIDPSSLTKSVIVAVRLTVAEGIKAVGMYPSETMGCENVAEWFRMLLHREYNRRHHLPKPRAADYQTAFRLGRPSKK